MTTRLAKDGLGIRAAPDEPGDSHRLGKIGALLAAHGLGEALDLREHRVTESEPLVAQLVHELGLEVVVGHVDRADGLEETQRNEGIDGFRHCWGKLTSGRGAEQSSARRVAPRELAWTASTVEFPTGFPAVPHLQSWISFPARSSAPSSLGLLRCAPIAAASSPTAASTRRSRSARRPWRAASDGPSRSQRSSTARC